MPTIEERIELTKEKYQKALKNIERYQHKYDTLDYSKVPDWVPADRKGRWLEAEKDNIANDIRSAINKASDIKNTLVNYMAKKSIEDKRNSILNTVPVIEDFLDNWMIKARDFYNTERTNYINYLKETNSKIEKICKENNINLSESHSYVQFKKIDDMLKSYKLDSKSIKKDKYNRFTIFTVNYYSNKEWDSILEKELTDEKKSKKIGLYYKIHEVAGNIIDAKDLYLSPKGDINGIIVGDKNTVNVRTIYAGGYNIQCLHFRVLVRII